MKSFLRGLALALVVILSIVAWTVLPWAVLLAVAVLFFLWMQLTRVGRQAGSATGVGISTLPQRVGSSSVVVVGIAGVVAVLVSLLAMGVGYSEALSNSGSTDTAIVMRDGSASEVSSVLEHDSILAIAEAPG